MLVAEPYSSMIYVAVLSGLRVSELIGLRWEDVHVDSLTVDERYCMRAITEACTGMVAELPGFFVTDQSPRQLCEVATRFDTNSLGL